MNGNLFKFGFMVRPSPMHPTYSDWEYGMLYIWLFSENEEMALGSMIKIIETMPYELMEKNEVTGAVRCRQCVGCAKNELGFRSAEMVALEFGFGAFLDPCHTDRLLPNKFEMP